jgi:hydrogenase expression/formation protein HypD
MKNILKQINILAKKINRRVFLMELCGTHTEAVARNGIKKILPKNIRLLSGPGCPVCVTDQRDIDAIVNLALNGIPIACYGDALRVPGNLALKSEKGSGNLSLNRTRELGADVNEVYSTQDALNLQKKKPKLVFFGLGFETTTPMTAYAIKKGLTVYSSHKLFVTAMQALIDTPTLKIDGFINPGHVSTIIGIEPYKRIMNYESGIMNVPQVITGFEAEDVLIGIYMLLKQISENRAEVENEYVRSVRPEGNPTAMGLINEVFEAEDALWRGLGKIPNSGLKIRKRYSEFDAKVKYKDILNSLNTKYCILNTNSGCICGAILRGLKEPKDCKLFNKKCTPENPVGACMVSNEGACGIEAKYL